MINTIIFIGILIIGTLLFSNFIFKKVLGGKQKAVFNLKLDDIEGKTLQEYIQFGDQWLQEQKVETLTLRTKDGLNLKGYFVPAKIKTNKVAVIVHGYSVNASFMAIYAQIYQNMGYNVFMADDRGHGKSDGKYIGMGWLDRLDYLQWTNLLIQKLGNDTEIVLYGSSMGGATVAMMSGEKLPSQVKCIVEDCGFSSVEEQMNHQLGVLGHIPTPLIGLISFESKILAGYSFSEANAVEQVKKSTTPILFIHGGADNLVPTRMVNELYNAAKCEKQLLIVPGASHGMSFHDAPELYVNTVKAFTEKYIK
jgi:uncharacterized protein